MLANVQTVDLCCNVSGFWQVQASLIRTLAVQSSSLTTSDYIYDGNGKRLVQKVTQNAGGKPTIKSTLYIGNLYEEDITTPTSQNPPYVVYYFLAEKMVSLRRANYGDGTDGTYRLVGDHLGSTTLVVDTSANPGPQVVHREYYKPYGEIAQSWGTSRTSVGYTGQRLDTDTGLMYYGARYYDPQLSLFVSADPTTPDASNPLDYNKYLYARANPLRFLDQLGYSPEDYYVFVNGCVSSDCNGTPAWGEYTAYLEDLYVNTWQAGDHDAFMKQWAPQHVFYVSAHDSESGSVALANKLSSIHGNGNINLVGHSAGAGAIMNYFIESMETAQAQAAGKTWVGPTIDKRISSVALIDGPLGADGIDAWLHWGENAIMNYVHGKRSQDVGDWVRSNTRIGTGDNAIDVDNHWDWVNSSPINDIRYVESPKYPNAPIMDTNTWHTYSMTHMAQETKSFFVQAWK